MLDNLAGLIVIEAAGINCKVIEFGIVDIYRIKVTQVTGARFIHFQNIFGRFFYRDL